MSDIASSWQRIHNHVAGSRAVFEDQLANTQQVQQRVLMQILKNNTSSSFAKAHDFSTISEMTTFQQNVPIQHYQDCLPYLDEMANNSDAKLLCFEATSGSTSGIKLIPYTERSIKLFQQALFPWFDDLLSHRPKIKTGTAYWSLSPVMREKQTTSGGHNIGLGNDALYFGESIAYEISQTLAVSTNIANIHDFKEWQFQTLLELLIAEDLSFISVWSPTFLLALIQVLPELAETLVIAIAKKDPVRANYLHPLLIEINSESLKRIWPNLDTISCWTDASSAGFIHKLKALFPDVYLQGKGLLATEGVVTIPLNQAPFPVLAINSGFYEFMDEQGQCKFAHQLQTGQTYSVILTNESSLYRYHLGDKVHLRGYYQGAPMLSFIGRGEHSSDLCGEKLTEDFINQVFSQYFTQSASSCFLYPKTSPQHHYVLMSENQLEDDELEQLDTCLRQNTQYDYARKLGQLGALQQHVVTNIMPRYTHWQMQHGQNLGDIKPPVLVTDKDFIHSLDQST